jgi:F420-0:gamma-glutamyl ligase
MSDSVEAPEVTDTNGQPSRTGRVIVLMAGAGFEPATFGL